MKFLLLFAFLIPSVHAACEVGGSVGCSVSEVCMATLQGPTCTAIPMTAPLVFNLPFDSNTEVACTHSSGIGSHSYQNAFYALDFANNYDQPAATILAAADGKAFVFYGEDGKPCAEPAGNPSQAEADNCGQGWGNHIKILHQNGYYSFYVHLEKILIKNGDIIKQGQPIGVEGWTGLAGHRHLHWSVQKLPGNNAVDWENRISWAGDSVPFQFQAIQEGKLVTLNSSQLKCAHAGLGQVPASEQPRMKGVSK